MGGFRHFEGMLIFPETGLPPGATGRGPARLVVGVLCFVLAGCTQTSDPNGKDNGPKGGSAEAGAGGGENAGAGGSTGGGGASATGGSAGSGQGGQAGQAGGGAAAGESGTAAPDAGGAGDPEPESPSVDASAPPPPPGAGPEVDRNNPQLHTFSFLPSDADPGASDRNLRQTAYLDTRAPKIQGKLVVTLSGVNGGPGPGGVARFAAGVGFHVFMVAYKNDINPSTQNDPDFFGEFRLEAFDAMDRTPRVNVQRPDCVEVRVAKALAHLAKEHPGGDWDYYLDQQGEVRWSDVIFAGHSHGASSAAAYAKIRTLHRAVSLAGPRDTRPVVATWLSAPSATPIDRYYAFTGTGDGQHQDHLKAFETLGLPGAVVDVGEAQPPYDNSHRLLYQGGHGGAADCNRYEAACRYMFGVVE